MTRSLMLFSLFLALFAASAIAETATVGQKESGLAAVYTSRLNHHVTSSGQIYDASKLTAAHKTLPPLREMECSAHSADISPCRSRN